MEELISIREFARRVGCSDTAVHKAIESGKISKDCLNYDNPKRPKIYPEAALKSWGRNYAPNWEQSETLSAALEKKEEAVVKKLPLKKIKAADVPTVSTTDLESLLKEFETGEVEFINVSSDADYKEAKRVEAIANAKLAQVRYAEQIKILVPRSQVDKEFFDVGARVRSAMQAIPDKLIDLILACKTRPEAHSILSGGITEALEHLVLTGE